MRNSVPPHTQVECQLARSPPVILEVGSPRNVVPESMVLDRKFVVAFGCPEQEISKVIPGEGAVKVERSLGRTEQVLDLLVERPASANFHLMASFRPGDIVSNLVVVCLVMPRPIGNFEVCARGTVQINVRDAIVVVGPGKESGMGGIVAVRQGKTLQTGNGKRHDVDEVAVVIKRSIIQCV